ncbi:MAG: hypothetical protein IPJ61_09185 [Tessaracoccus sp.]|uniref:hypothetical protein n=1 Tax=Tessaracoccus sp. TaxID=1971211 RepID=UPI001ED25048|nr:hypothetical protein [Tessaracoccus sp.]MBK7821235.1 hypothetical protein [Tessaracoccus sp.]
MIGRAPVTLAAAAGAVTAGIAAQAASSPVGSLAWAAAAGIGLSLMLRGVGLRVVGVLLTALAVTGAGWSVQAGQWVACAGFAVVAVAALGVVVWGPRWRTERASGSGRALDPWAAMDKGEDPTTTDAPADEQDMRSQGGSG